MNVVQPLRATLEAGAALYGELRALLAEERGALARHDLAAVQAANVRRQALLEAIAGWEQGAVDWLAQAPPAPDGATTLGAAVGMLPEGERAGAARALAALRTAAEAARHEAAVNHIVVERSLDTVARTLDIVTGRPSRITYGPKGEVDRGTVGGLMGRKG